MRKLPEEVVAYVVEHFKDTENITLAKEAGCSPSSVNHIQRRYNLKKSKEHLHEAYQKCGKKAREMYGNPPIDEDGIRRRADTFMRMYREEKARSVWGLPPKTRIRVRREPRLKTSQRTYLRSLGYIIDRENNIAYWTPDTKRAVRMEAYTKKRSYYKFRPYEHEQHQREPGDLAVAGE